MGATTFLNRTEGKTARDAFTQARIDAQYENGHGGYTGTIAEKGSFVLIACPAGVTPAAHARDLLDEDDERISDKWGPAGCIDCGDGKFLFFGWASE